MRKYKNVSAVEQVIVGVGVVPAGQEFITHHEIENPNIEDLGEVDEPSQVVGVQTKQPQAVVDPVPVDIKDETEETK